MPSTLSSRRLSEEDFGRAAYTKSALEPASRVNLPQFTRTRPAHHANERSAIHRQQHLNAHRLGSLARPQLVPAVVPVREGRRAPLVVRANRLFRTALVALCGVVILGYGLDVATSSDVSRLQEQARRLNEQNSELSAKLLRAISYQGIQDSVLGRFGLHVPEQVLIVKEVQPPQVPSYKACRHNFPIMAGY